MLYGLEFRQRLAPRWDAGVHGSALHSLGSEVTRYASGFSVGHNPMRSTWISVGYNFFGFEDEDFAAAEYTARGPFVKLRVKVDQSHMDRFLGFVGWRERG